MSFSVTTNSSQAKPLFCQSAMSQIRFRISARERLGAYVGASRGSFDFERKSKAASRHMWTPHAAALPRRTSSAPACCQSCV